MKFLLITAAVAAGALVGAALAWGGKLDPTVGGTIGGGLAFVACAPFMGRGRR